MRTQSTSTIIMSVLLPFGPISLGTKLTLPPSILERVTEEDEFVFKQLDLVDMRLPLQLVAPLKN